MTVSASYERMIELGQVTHMVDPYFFFGVMEEHFWGKEIYTIFGILTQSSQNSIS